MESATSVKTHEYVDESELIVTTLPPNAIVESCDDYELPGNQTAGHSKTKGYSDWLCKPDQHILLKPFLGKKSYHERSFYVELYSTLSQGMKDFLPEFYGLRYIKFPDGRIQEYIAMKDYSSYFKKPSILDIKMGKRTYDDQAEQWKIDYEISKYPQQEQTGMRFAGMKLYNKSTGEYTKFDAKQARFISEEMFPDTFHKFFSNDGELRLDFVQETLKKLQELLNVFEKAEDGLNFVASSVLILYEGLEQTDKIFVKLIDFAHTTQKPAGTQDEGFIYGLKKLIQHLEKLIALNAQK